MPVVGVPVIREPEKVSATKNGCRRSQYLRVRHCLWSGSPDRHNVPPPGKGLLRSRIPPHALAVYPRLADITFIAQGHQHEQLFIDIFAAPAA